VCVGCHARTFQRGGDVAPSKSVSGPNPLEAPGAQQIQLKMHEWEIEFGYSFGF